MQFTIKELAALLVVLDKRKSSITTATGKPLSVNKTDELIQLEQLIKRVTEEIAKL